MTDVRLATTTGRRYREKGSTMSLSATASVLTALVDSPGAREVAFGGNSMQHGTAVFEGIRCYRGRTGVNAFRLDDHLRRLLASARALGVQHRYGLPELRGHVLRAAVTSGLTDQYVRPALYCEQPRLGVELGSLPYSLGVEVWPAGTDFQWCGSPPDDFAVASARPGKLSGRHQGNRDLCDLGNRQYAGLTAGLR